MKIAQLKQAASLLEKLAITYEEYKKLHPRTKKTPDDPLFTKNPGRGPAPAKPEPAKKPKAPATSDATPKMEVALDAENPRDAAKKSIKAEIEEDYAFARESDVSNLGEDLAESARHKRNRWKGLEDAEKEGTAEELVTRDNLLKNEPPNILAKVTPDTSLTALAMHSALKKFPPAPDTTRYDRSEANAIFRVEYVDESGKMIVSNPSFDIPAGAKDVKKITYGDMKKTARKQYMDMYKQTVAKMEELSATKTDYNAALDELRTMLTSKIQELRRTDYYSPIANQLVPMVNRVLSTYKRNPTCAANVVKEFQKLSQEKYGESPEKEKLAEHVKDIIEGRTMNEVFDKKKSREGQFDPTEVYVKVAERVGPKTGLTTQKKQTDFLMKQVGLRGLQWGNSVTDEERVHHLQKSAEAMKDLTDVLGLPAEIVSFHGRLGFAIGARGKGNALAHYEPTMRVINITRKSGVGSVAHEWGHFFDNVLSELESGSRSGYYSEFAGAYGRAVKPNGEQGDETLRAKMRVIREHLDKFETRMRKLESFNKLSPGRRQYWSSTRELFARAFEKWVDHKLTTMNRKNTYLAGALDHDFWPSKDEIAEMSPAFDELFSYFKSSKHMKKAMLLAEWYNLWDRVSL